MNPPTNRRADGATQEELALEYLLGLGYRLVKKNFQFGKVGEIDLVMRDGEIYVFVEVKARRSHGFGTPEDAVTMGKRRQIRKVAEGFIHINQMTDYEARFDVVAIDYVTGQDGKPEIRHHKDAF
ncbi:MAG: YraN family protein [Armatimonadetes bacterium]|nr:YraN family protein [Armatimonadota bacterium]